MNRKNLKKHRFSGAMAGMMTGILAVAFVGFLVAPKHGLSTTENRILTQRPNLDKEDILSGAFEKKWDQFVDDQFPLRDLFVRIRSDLSVAVGKRESQGIYLGRHQELMEQFSPYDTGSHQKKMNGLRKFCQKNPDLKQYMLIAPTAVQTLRDDLPSGVSVTDQKEYIDRLYRDVTDMGVTPVDVSGELTKLGQKAYYHTDHHWTTAGAYAAAEKTLRMMNLDPGQVEYTAQNVCDDFRGQLSYKSGMCANAKENIQIYFPKNGVDSVVNYVQEQRKSASLYEPKLLSSKNAYGVFLGGNHSLVKIANAVDSDRVLLMFKDSYANCFIPFLTPYFKEIVVVDPRYYYEDVQELIEAEEVTDVLYLYNANTFFTDNSLNYVLSE